jgi:hypothetical protein
MRKRWYGSTAHNGVWSSITGIRTGIFVSLLPGGRISLSHKRDRGKDPRNGSAEIWEIVAGMAYFEHGKFHLLGHKVV